MFRNVLLVSLVCLLAVTAANASTVLTFDSVARAYNGGSATLSSSIPQDYGDRVTASSVVGSRGAGAPFTYGGDCDTGNVEVFYGHKLTGTASDQLTTSMHSWSGATNGSWAYAGDFDGYAASNYFAGAGIPGNWFTFTADAGYEVTLESFQTAIMDDAGVPLPVDAKFEVYVDGVLAWQSNGGAELAMNPGDEPTPGVYHYTWAPNLTGQEIKLWATSTSVNDKYAIAFDNITFSQSAVPEPASMAVLALGALGLLHRRRA
jgi:hypothetical protein